MNLSDIGIIVERKFKEFKKKGSKRKASFSPPIEDALPKKIKTPDLRNTSKTIEDSLVILLTLTFTFLILNHSLYFE